MRTPTQLKPGDRCPNCGGTFVAAPTPTPEQRQKAADRENPEQLPPHFDSATDAQREELGALFKCNTCGYKTRFPVEATAGAAETRQAGGGGDEVDKQRRDQAVRDEQVRKDREQRDRDYQADWQRKREEEDRNRRAREDWEKQRETQQQPPQT